MGSLLIVLLGAMLIEHFYVLEPCPMCEMQRINLALLFVLIGCEIFGRGKRFLRFLIKTFLLLGLILALRQSWLQYHPELAGSNCLPSLAMIYSFGGFKDLVTTFWYGSSECAKIDWSIFGITLPMLLSIFYMVVLVLRSMAAKCLDKI